MFIIYLHNQVINVADGVNVTKAQIISTIVRHNSCKRKGCCVNLKKMQERPRLTLPVLCKTTYKVTRFNLSMQAACEFFTIIVSFSQVHNSSAQRYHYK